MNEVKYIDYLLNGAYLMPRAVSILLQPFPLQFRIYEYFLRNAVFKPEGIMHAGIKLKRGQLLKSVSLLREDLYFYENNKKLYYPKRTLLNNIEKLESKGLIKTISSSTLGTLYEVVIYNIFQDLNSYSNDTLHNLRTTLAQALHNPSTNLEHTLQELDTTLAQALLHKNKGNEVSNVLNESKESNVGVSVSEGESVGTPNENHTHTHAHTFLFLKDFIDNKFKELYEPLNKEILIASGLNNIADVMKLPLLYQWLGLKHKTEIIENDLFDNINLQIDNKINSESKNKNYITMFYSFLNTQLKENKVTKISEDELFFYAVNSVNYEYERYEDFMSMYQDIYRDLEKSIVKKYELIGKEFYYDYNQSLFLKANQDTLKWKCFYDNRSVMGYHKHIEYFIFEEYDFIKKNLQKIEDFKNKYGYDVFVKFLEYEKRVVIEDLFGNEYYCWQPTLRTIDLFIKNDLPLPDEDEGEILEFINQQLKSLNSNK